MKFNAARFAVMAACVAVAASAHAQTGDWGDLAVVSGTLGNNANRLCLGVPASMRPADIGCPVYAPYVSPTNGFVGIGTTSPLSQLHLGNQRSPGFGHLTLGGSNNAGLITFLNPSGSPHGLVGYVSTTDNEFGITANGGSGYISLKTGGAERMRVVNGGSVGIGTTTPSTRLHVSGTLRISNGGEACDANRAGAIRYTSSSVFQFCMGSGWQNLADAAGGGQADRIASGTTSVIATEDRSVTISTAGSQRVVIGENGNVGVGTSAPDSPLVVRGPDNGVARWLFKVLNLAGANESGFYQYSNNAVALQLRNGSGSLRVNLQPSGNSYILDNNVGIGTTTPAATLQVSGNFIVSTSAQTTTPSLYVGTNGNVGIGTKTPTSGFVGGRVIHLEDTGTNLPNFRAKSTNVDALFGVDLGRVYFGSVSNHDIRFITSGTSFPRMVVRSNGNVGIGTTSPNAKLDVYGTISATNLLINGQPVDGQADRIISGTTNVIATQDRSVTISTAGTQRVVVGEDGNVGIGTVAPTRLLTLSGAQNTSGISLTETTYGGQLSLEPRGYTTGEYQIRMTGPATQGIGFKVGGGGTAFIDYDGTRFTVQPAQGAFSTGAWNTRVYGQLAVDSTASASFTAVSVTANSGQIADIVNITKSGGLPLLKVNKNGNVGIGTSVPSTTLHVSGSVRIADGGEACDASRIGTIRYNADAQAFQMCRP